MRHQHKHGGSYTQEYRAWQTMRLRCLNPANPAYGSYGGRGITVCERWRNDFNAFLADVGRKPSPKHEIDRIDNDGSYQPGNVRWVTRSENDRNRRNTTWVEYRGGRRRLIDLCEQFGIGTDTARCRLRAGWSVERAIETPVRRQVNSRRDPAPRRPVCQSPRFRFKREIESRTTCRVEGVRHDRLVLSCGHVTTRKSKKKVTWVTCRECLSGACNTAPRHGHQPNHGDPIR